MGDLGYVVSLAYKHTFGFSSWSRSKKAASIALLVYTSSLYGFIGTNMIEDHKLNQGLRQKGITIEAREDETGRGVATLHVLQNGKEITSTIVGNSRGIIINQFGRLADKIGVYDKIGRVIIEENPEKLAEYGEKGYKKFAASYYVIASSYWISLIHPLGILTAPAGLYLNWDGEAELFYSRYKLKTHNEKEINLIYSNIGLLLYAVSPITFFGYLNHKIKKYFEPMPSVTLNLIKKP